MDSEQFWFLEDGDMDGVDFQPLPADELGDVERHVELVRHLQELHQLYEIVLFNLDVMRHNYDWRSSGEVRYKGKPAVEHTHFIAVNALIVNLIGSARTLTESMDCYIKENYPAGDPAAQAYFDFSRHIYDKCFAYRFLIRLRDFSQHGHPPVSLRGTNYAFDLRQIVETPHFNHNPRIKEQLETAVKEIMEGMHGYPTVGVTMTVAEFTVGLLKIYDHFLTCVEPELKRSNRRFCSILEAHPENVWPGEGERPDFFIYDIRDSNAQTVIVGDDTMEMLGNYRREEQETLAVYQKDWDGLKEAVVAVGKDGEKHPFSIL